MSLQIKNETVYVIYRNGEPYNSAGRKIVYTTKGAARGVITNEAKDSVRNSYDFDDWYELGSDKKEELIQKVVDEFEIIEYVPKKLP